MKYIDIYVYTKDKPNHLRYLLLMRSNDKVYSGQWRMIGGKINSGESAYEAAIRELREETGVSPVSFWTLPSINHFYDPNTDSIELIPAFAAELSADANILLNEEHITFKWVSLLETQSMLYWPEQKRLFRLLDSILLKGQILSEWQIKSKS